MELWQDNIWKENESFSGPDTHSLKLQTHKIYL